MMIYYSILNIIYFYHIFSLIDVQNLVKVVKNKIELSGVQN